MDQMFSRNDLDTDWRLEAKNKSIGKNEEKVDLPNSTKNNELGNRGNCPSFEPLLDAFLKSSLNNSTEFQSVQELMKKYA